MGKQIIHHINISGILTHVFLPDKINFDFNISKFPTQQSREFQEIRELAVGISVATAITGFLSSDITLGFIIGCNKVSDVALSDCLSRRLCHMVNISVYQYVNI